MIHGATLFDIAYTTIHPMTGLKYGPSAAMGKTVLPTTFAIPIPTDSVLQSGTAASGAKRKPRGHDEEHQTSIDFFTLGAFRISALVKPRAFSSIVINIAEENFLVEDRQVADAGDAPGTLIQQIAYGRHLEPVEDGTKRRQGGFSILFQEQLEELLEDAVVGGLVDRHESQDRFQGRIASHILDAFAKIIVIDEGRMFLDHGVSQHAQRVVVREIPFARENLLVQVGHVFVGALPGTQQPIAQHQGMFRFFIAPVGVEPGPALAVANDGQHLGYVIGQIQFDGAERLPRRWRGPDSDGDCTTPRECPRGCASAFFSPPGRSNPDTGARVFLPVREMPWEMVHTSDRFPVVNIQFTLYRMFVCSVYCKTASLARTVKADHGTRVPLRCKKLQLFQTFFPPQSSYQRPFRSLTGNQGFFPSPCLTEVLMQAKHSLVLALLAAVGLIATALTLTWQSTGQEGKTPFQPQVTAAFGKDNQLKVGVMATLPTGNAQTILQVEVVDDKGQSVAKSQEWQGNGQRLRVHARQVEDGQGPNPRHAGQQKVRDAPGQGPPSQGP